eukprot:EG_transcript_55125
MPSRAVAFLLPALPALEVPDDDDAFSTGPACRWTAVDSPLAKGPLVGHGGGVVLGVRPSLPCLPVPRRPASRTRGSPLAGRYVSPPAPPATDPDSDGDDDVSAAPDRRRSPPTPA